MKNFIKSTFAFILLISSFSCSNDDSLKLDTTNLDEKVELKKSTDLVTPFFQNLGGTEIIELMIRLKLNIEQYRKSNLSSTENSLLYPIMP
jgi:hypothetical protein